MTYCAASGPGGFLCVLAKGHTGDHLSIRNDRLWKGTPGAPVRWPARSGVIELALDPLRTNAEIVKADSTELGTSRGMGYTGDICGTCGSSRMRRAGACVVCEGCGSTSSCG